ncbi:MAG: AprI/Inh family metalloprotease inhibitor [Ahrensia sp.]|nr:AprI/Inh family metalloprotease inhibitor [Ahrensia sp.]
MGQSLIRSLAFCAVAGALLSGCQSARLGALETQARPAPLTPAPSGRVTSGQLPPPVQPDAATQAAEASQVTQGQFPEAPAGTQIATAPPVAAPTASAPSVQNVSTNAPVTKEALVGAWKVSTSGSSCQMFMALTKWSGGFRAASRGCPGDAAAVTAWNVSGNRVVLSDTNGNEVATLFPTGSGAYNGQTKGGSAITLSR